jgi:hypothetical protein
MSPEPFDALTVALGAATSRRQVLRLLVSACAGGLVAGLGLPLATRSSAQAAEPCVVEYPPKDLNDCPIKRVHPGNERKGNGCGEEGGRKFPEFFGNASFLEGCNEHDICYETCDRSKFGCDFTLYTQLVEACQAAYPGPFNILARRACMEIASWYFGAVVVAGKDAFEKAQKKDCECCRPPRPCNGCENCQDGKCSDVCVPPLKQCGPFIGWPNCIPPTSSCCPDPTRADGGFVCADGAVCCGQTCCPTTSVCFGDLCCPAGWSVCGGVRCCPPGGFCCGENCCSSGQACQEGACANVQ